MFSAAIDAGNPFAENVFGRCDSSSESEWISSKYLMKYEAVYERLKNVDSKVSREGIFL